MFSSARADSASCRRCSSKLFSSLFSFFLPFRSSPALLLMSCCDFQFPPLLCFLAALLFCNLNSVFFFTFSHTVCAWGISSSATSYCCWCSSAWSIISSSDPRGQSGWCARWPPSWSAACRCGSRRCACHGRSCSAHIHQNVPQTCLFFLLRSFLLDEMQLRASFICLFCWCFLFGLLLFFFMLHSSRSQRLRSKTKMEIELFVAVRQRFLYPGRAFSPNFVVVQAC